MKNNTHKNKPWNKNEGVFIGFDGKFIVSVPSKGNVRANKFQILSQHKTKELAEQIYNEYKTNNP